MALEEGSEEIKPKKNKIASTPDVDLLKVVQDLQAQIIALQKNQAQPPVAINSTGMSAEQFERWMKAANQTNDTGAPIEIDKLDQDDYLAEPVKFTSPTVFKVITEDFKQGRSIKLPNGKTKIEFTHAGTKYIKDGNTVRQNNISRYWSSSKKEVAFLRQHWEYGMNFYETDKEAMNADGMKIIKMTRIFQGLLGMDAIKIIGTAKSYNIPINEDINVTRVDLANAMVAKEIEQETGFTKQILAETTNEKLLYEKRGVA